MPQTDSAKKALRINERRRVINDRWRRKMRTHLKEVREAIVAQQKPAAETALKAAQKALDRAVRHGVMNARTAARKKSRLAHAIAKLA